MTVKCTPRKSWISNLDLWVVLKIKISIAVASFFFPRTHLHIFFLGLPLDFIPPRTSGVLSSRDTFGFSPLPRQFSKLGMLLLSTESESQPQRATAAKTYRENDPVHGFQVPLIVFAYHSPQGQPLRVSMPRPFLRSTVVLTASE